VCDECVENECARARVCEYVWVSVSVCVYLYVRVYVSLGVCVAQGV